jgi:ATP/maltotriose-dependent transcriptional regulator MalT
MRTPAGSKQSNAGRRDQRIIERPRLIEALDQTEARTILMLAPAGYGKTTLARQWSQTLRGAIWITASRAHRDVSTLARDLAERIDEVGASASKFIDEYLRARNNPQGAAREVARMLAKSAEAARVQWVVIDDYHELTSSPEAEALLEVFHEELPARFLVASRIRPAWASSRRVVYGQIAEIARESLAMNDAESQLVLGRRPGAVRLAEQSEGWPAVIGLAAGIGRVDVPDQALPAALHDFFADELYRSAPSALQAELIGLALASDLTDEVLRQEFGAKARSIVEQARELGFLSIEGTVDLHPLIREFLLQKLSEDPGCEARIRKAIAACVGREAWGRAFELILRFGLMDLVQSTLEASYKPLLRSGRLATLSDFAGSVRVAPTFPPPIVDLVEADAAFRNGAYGLAADIASRVRAALPEGHSLLSKANAIIGQSAYIHADLPRAEEAYRLAYETATDADDQAEALYGWVLASVQGEVSHPGWIVSRLEERKNDSPLDLTRHAIAEVVRRRFAEGFPDGIPVDEAMHTLAQVEDPRVRSSLVAVNAYVTGLRADYRCASELVRVAQGEINAFDLDFARSHANWTQAFIELGLRRFGAAERALQLVEDEIQDKPLGYHVLNARVLRARLALQTGQRDLAIALVQRPDVEAAIPSIHGEYLATRAVVLAVTGDASAAEAASTAERTSTAVEVQTLARAAVAILAARSGETDGLATLWRFATRTGIWDPVVFALRSSPELSDLAAADETLRPELAQLYERSADLGLARRAGLRTRTARDPGDVLTPRESEVAELLARGFRNRDISKALVISDSTTKVHVRHILEKLGAHTSSEVVARFNGRA